MNPKNNLIKLFPLDEAYAFGIQHGLQNEISNIQSMKIDQWLPEYESATRNGYVVELFIQKNIFDTFKQTHWPNGNTKGGERRINYYLYMKNISTPEGRQIAKYTGVAPIYPATNTVGFIGNYITVLYNWRHVLALWVKSSFTRRK